MADIDVLDKIRAEIEEIETYDGLYIDRAYVLQIIDKHNAKPKDIEAQDIEMQATEFLATARACADKD